MTGETRRGTLIVLTVVSLLLALPALVLAAFSGFAFDDPDGQALAWVLAGPFLTLPLSILVCVPASWWLHLRARYDTAVRVAAVPVIHLFVALAGFFVIVGFGD